MRLALKTGSYGIVHIAVATSVAYALTGDLAIALGIGLLEPIVQTVVFAIHERIWEGGSSRQVGLPAWFGSGAMAVRSLGRPRSRGAFRVRRAA